MGKGIDISKKKDKRQKQHAIRLQISQDSRFRQACHYEWYQQLNPDVGELGFDRLEIVDEDDERDQQQHEDDELDDDELDQQQHEDDELDDDELDQQQHELDQQQHENDQQQHEDDERDQQHIPDEADLPLGGPAPHHQGPAPPGAARGPAPPRAARPGPAPHH